MNPCFKQYNRTIFFQVNSSPKGQVEIILQMCEADLTEEEDHETADTSASSGNKRDEQKRRLSFNDVKNRLKNLNISKKEKYKGMCLKVTTSKMRCSIKVKEEFESFGGIILFVCVRLRKI